MFKGPSEAGSFCAGLAARLAGLDGARACVCPPYVSLAGAVQALAGSGIEMGAAPRVALAVLFFVVSGAIGIWLYRRYRHGKTLGDEVEKAI